MSERPRLKGDSARWRATWLAATLIGMMAVVTNAEAQPNATLPRTFPSGVIYDFGSRGSQSAVVTLLVFSDFNSFFCARSASVLVELSKLDSNVRLIFKHAPGGSPDATQRRAMLPSPPLIWLRR